MDTGISRRCSVEPNQEFPDSTIEPSSRETVVRESVQTTELKVAAVGNAMGFLTPWNPQRPAPVVNDSLLIALEDPFLEGTVFAELGEIGQVVGVAQEPGVFRFDLKSQLTPGLHRIRFRWTDPQFEPHSHFVSRPMWIAFRHSQPDDPVIRNMPALARRSLSSTARQEFARQYSNSIAGLDRLLKEPYDDACLTNKVDQIIERQAPRCEVQVTDGQEVWPLPPAIPYCQCMPMAIEHAAPVPHAPSAPSASELPNPKSEATPVQNPSGEDPTAYDQNHQSIPHHRTRLVLTELPEQGNQLPEPVAAQRMELQRDPQDIATESNLLLGELERMQARSEQACAIAAYLEAQELLQDRTLNCLTAKKVVSTIEFDTPTIFAGTTFTGDRTGALVGDLTILEGMKLDVYGDGRYALSFKYLRPSKPVTLHLQVQCWIDEESGWKTLTLPPISINPAYVDPNNPMKDYSYSGHSRALERSSGYVQKARRTGAAVTGYGLNNPSDLRSY